MVDRILENLNIFGYDIINIHSYEDAKNICIKIGNIIYENDISPNLLSKSLSNSYKALDFHTDHHQAEWIGIYCIQQSKTGGETKLIDSYQIINLFTKDEIEILKTIYLFEHRVFKDDPEEHPNI